MNGVKRRTFAVRSMEGNDNSTIVADNLLTIEEAMAQTRVALVERFDQYIHDHGLLVSAKDHRLVVRPMATGHGMQLIEECESRPCPWLGDGADYQGPSSGQRYVFSAWFYGSDGEGLRGE